MASTTNCNLLPLLVLGLLFSSLLLVACGGDDECDAQCDPDACEECVGGDCVSYCVEGEICDGDGGCALPATECDPPCDPDACEECVDGDCVSYCAEGEICDGEGGCLAARRVIGATCTSNEDCRFEGAFCLTEFHSGVPGGFCTIGCGFTDCPEGSACLLRPWLVCAPACNLEHDDCRDGLTCSAFSEGGVCWAGCTDSIHCTATDYCDVDSGFCECPVGFVPDHDAEVCEQFVCEAIEVFEDTFLVGNTCNEGTEIYTGEHCLRRASFGHEVVFSLQMPPHAAVDVEVVGVDYDATLWVTTDCYDFSGAYCVASSDEAADGEPEIVTIINATDDEITYFIVADTDWEPGMAECGSYQLTIGEFEAIEYQFDCENTLLNESFDAVHEGELPAGWELDWTEGNETWGVVSDRSGHSLNGTPFLIVDSDAASFGATHDEAVITPAVDVTGHDSLTLMFEQYYNHLSGSEGTVQVFDGADWQDVLVMTGTQGNWSEPHEQIIDITEHANEELRIRFIYQAGSQGWWAVDNVRICG